MSDDLTTYRKVQAAIAALSKGDEATHDGTEWFYPAAWYADDAPDDANLAVAMNELVRWLDNNFPDGEPEPW